ncbi:pilus assembly protein PilP [Pelosinus sp. IPA-1]|uniref:pilus assembly protein PilP n=1 Tax=Pelosinus sp. IPA-1 TaxID=3029569 RepID=UPI00243621FA|nr:pilus assembly protein PilP [Pelosinus sp. IPA-1]GMA99453.1 hypothetical protein PIPA1_22530 [Pelosinus sp. IPA-1]
MEFSDQIGKFTAKQRLGIILGVGSIAFIITMYITPTEVVTAPAIPKQANTEVVKSSSNKAIMIVGQQSSQTNQVFRDPFCIPSEFQEKTPITNNVRDQGYSKVSSSNRELTASEKLTAPIKAKESVTLTGIVSTDNQRLAVIQSANKSKAYQLYEFIGAYQLVAIQDDTVILKDNDSQLVLPLETPGKKGGRK